MINVITARCPAAKWPSLHHPTDEFIQHIKNSSKSRSWSLTLGHRSGNRFIHYLLWENVMFDLSKCLLIWVKQIKLMFICSMKSKLFSSWSQFNNIFLLTFIVNIWAIHCCQRNPEKQLLFIRMCWTRFTFRLWILVLGISISII